MGAKGRSPAFWNLLSLSAPSPACPQVPGLAVLWSQLPSSSSRFRNPGLREGEGLWEVPSPPGGAVTTDTPRPRGGPYPGHGGEGRPLRLMPVTETEQREAASCPGSSRRGSPRTQRSVGRKSASGGGAAAEHRSGPRSASVSATSCSAPSYAVVFQAQVLLPRDILRPVTAEFLNNTNITSSLPLKISQRIVLVSRMKFRLPADSLDSGSLAGSVCVSRSVMSDFCDPMNCGPPGSSAHGILQARILEWVAISFSMRSSPPRD